MCSLKNRRTKTGVSASCVDDGEVEVVLDHALRDVRRELGMADDLGHGTRTPAFVGGLELGGRADCECRDYLERERGSVIVVYQEDDVRPLLPFPLLGELVAVEYLGPVRLAGLTEVERGPDGGHVRGVNR